jgi:hypothetical protein
MSSKEKDIHIIHNCEEHFYNWLKFRLLQKGILVDKLSTLTDILVNHEKELIALKQHIKQLKKWNRIKDEFYKLNTRLNGDGENDEYLQSLIEKVAFEGQILWLTIQED